MGAHKQPERDVDGEPVNGKPLSFMDRRVQAYSADGNSLGSVDDPAKESYPMLWEALTRTDVNEELVKTPAKITLQSAPGGFIATLYDSDMCYSLEVPLPYLGQLWELVEQAMNGEGGTLKVNTRKEPTLRKRRNKK